MPDYDVIVVGSGAGAGAAASALADAGVRTLVVERGERLADTRLLQDEQRMLIDRVASDDRPITIDGERVRPLIGGTPGGSTSLYGAALIRPSPEDFVPGRHYGPRVPRAVWDWPFQYEDLAPYYDRAEDLFRVCGDAAAVPPHLGRRPCPYVAPTPPLDPFNARLRAALRREGTRPFALPLAIDFDRCLRCPTCPGYGCPTGARTSTDTTLLRPRAEKHELDLWTGVEALELIQRGGRVRGLRVRQRRTGHVHEVSAEHFLLGAGALGTPVLLERSRLAERSGQLGRNHMCHIGAVAIAVWRRSIGADETFLKRLGLTDFYFGTESLREKMGLAQSIPVPGPRSIEKQLGVRLPRAATEWAHRRSLLMTGTVEDLPRPGNRVQATDDGGLALRRRFGRYDVQRAKVLAGRLAKLLRRSGAAIALPHVASNDRDHLAHQVGTCRAGHDPTTSVVDRDGVVHGEENVRVVDGSVFPTSLGVGPALTIAAHALRVADTLIEPPVGHRIVRRPGDRRPHPPHQGDAS